MSTAGPPAAWDPGLGETLHFRPALIIISGYCVTTAAREAVRSLWPITDRQALEQRFLATAELHQMVERSSLPPLGAFPDIRPALALLEKGGATLSAERLHQVRSLLQAAQPVYQFLREQKDIPYWRDQVTRLDPWPQGTDQIDLVVDDDLSIKSSASPELRHIREAVRRSEERVRRRLEELHAKALQAGWGQSEPIAWREGRLVIALKASHKRKIKGLIHGHSSSGATAFVEPLEVFDLNNEIAALQEEERAEITRLLAALTDALRPYSEPLGQCVETLHHLDMHLAQARWAHKLSAVQPSLVEQGELRLVQAVNPVLAEHREVVPLDLVLGGPERLLLISGPNAGGKTVVLLTVGLLVMLAQCGIFVPAKAAQMPLYQGLFADLGDRQSLESDLSTFSAHLTNLRDIAAHCTSESLVLLDELGTGTEPEAGAALAQTFLERIGQSGAWCLATTHLNRLKLWAQDAPGIENAGMEFDPRELRPTYRLLQGRPGASYALEIARRMGLDEELLSRAQELIPEAAVNLEELLVSLREDRAALDHRRQELAGSLKELEKRERKLARMEQEIKVAHRRAKQDALREAEQLVAQMNRRLEAAIAELRSKGAALSREDIRQAKELVTQEKERIQVAQEDLSEAQPAPLPPGEIQPGQWVTLHAQDRRGQVVRLSRNRRKVTVQVGGARLTVPLEQLAWAEPPGDDEGPTSRTAAVRYKSSGAGGYRLDLRGERGEEAVARLDRFISQAIVADLRELEIIHGKGTGILQKLVHESLAEHPQVSSYRFANFDAGGTGMTVVELK
ncbi:MAG: Smr/MutS family protein [Candidatus Marinimicrobia bacterium]|nr:Smr/MutS family protein [Candidatus Neomarinimicrobiota bacterium]